MFNNIKLFITGAAVMGLAAFALMLGEQLVLNFLQMMNICTIAGIAVGMWAADAFKRK